MFKVGDKVRVIASIYDDMFIGRIATVTAGPLFDDGVDYMITTDPDLEEHTFPEGGKDFHACYMDYELELVE